jgi:hypothetical protein
MMVLYSFIHSFTISLLSQLIQLGYDFHKYGMSLEDVLYEEKKKMGHAFVLLMLLRGTKYWESPNATKLAATHRYKSKHSQ